MGVGEKQENPQIPEGSVACCTQLKTAKGTKKKARTPLRLPSALQACTMECNLLIVTQIHTTTKGFYNLPTLLLDNKRMVIGEDKQPLTKITPRKKISFFFPATS